MKFFDRWTRRQKEKASKDGVKAEKSAASVSVGKKEEAVLAPTVKPQARKFHPASALLLAPLVTEKSTYGQSEGQYGFKVRPAANKCEIKKAVEALYGVKVEKVRMINYQGKKKRYGRLSGRRKDWKKAIVSLKPGYKIEIHQSV